MFWRKPTTVNEAIAPLLKTLKNLEAVGANLGAAMISAKEEISRLTAKNQARLSEVERAKTILKKLNEIVGE